jgi:3-deoxy-D-manno-octulosonic-acid transferase
MKLYKFITLLASPFINLYLLKRKMIGKEDPARFNERLGRPGRARPEGNIVWIHAASVGESLSVIPLINRLAEQFPDIKILLTTGTTTSAKLVETRLPANAFHQYIPVDSILAVKRFLKNWQPGLALWVESEFWPNLLTETAKQCPVLLINARISDRSFATWKKYRSISTQLLNNFSLLLPQSKQDAIRLKELGGSHIKLIGNLKYDAPTLPADAEKLNALTTAIQNRPVWVAASTHPNEEEVLAEAHKIVKAAYPDLLTIIVPRHAHRGKDLSSQLEALQCKVALRSAEQPITSDTDIYIADTMGELGIFYRLANIVFIGGSIIKHGGQNPLEAARLGAAIITGPHMENFRDIMTEFEENKACIRIQDTASLASTIQELLQNPEKQKQLEAAALSIAQAKGEILDGYIAEIQPYIENLTRPAIQQHVA